MVASVLAESRKRQLASHVKHELDFWPSGPLEIRPVTFRQACAFVSAFHRHNKPPIGAKFSIGCYAGEALVGVAIVGRPVARILDDGRTAEICRTCTDGTRNANSKLYAAAVRACKAMGYLRVVTYTQGEETGASLRGAGFRIEAELPARGSWADHSVKLRNIRDVEGSGGVARIRWVA